jgi:hypothetical protein
MTLPRNSVATWLLVTTLVAFALAPLASLSDATLTALMYVKFTIMIIATFLVRYGPERNAAWWFGFSTFGWASILISVPGLWYSIGAVNLAPGINLADLNRSIGEQVAAAMTSSSRPAVNVNEIDIVVQSWFMILAAMTGGFLSLALDRRSQRRVGLDVTSDSTNSR